MGIIVRILGSGLGMASEAIHDYRARSRSGHSASPNPAASSSSSCSRAMPASTPVPDAPPEYVEVADEATAEKLVRSGKAERVVDHPDQGRASSLSRQKSKAEEAGHPEADDDGTSGDDESSDAVAGANDEAAWELDDMAERVAPPSYAESEAEAAAAPAEGDSEEAKAKKVELMIRDLVRLAGPAPQPLHRIPCPVIIPQRRPRNKDRGFVRAYAPVLEECGVGQEVFLKFLKDWLVASKADPWIDVIYIAAGVVGFAPELAAQIVSTVVQVAAGTARELQSRHRRNAFLDRVNEQLFMPRGLYAMVMAFKDDLPAGQSGPLSRLAGSLGQTLFAAERLDISQTAAKSINPDPNMSKLKKGLKDIRLASGKTRGEIELPEAAALVYPDLDRVAERDLELGGKGKGPESQTTKEKWRGAGEWVQDYLDRKAQASYEMDHQGSSLAVPESSRQAFSSRFSDPSHPANSGSLIALLTGGAVDPRARRRERRESRRERREFRRETRDQRRVARGRSPRGARAARPLRGQRKSIIRKIMQQDVLYLLIVNIPTQEEVQQSVADLERIVTASGPSK